MKFAQVTPPPGPVLCTIALGCGLSLVSSKVSAAQWLTGSVRPAEVDRHQAGVTDGDRHRSDLATL